MVGIADLLRVLISAPFSVRAETGLLICASSNIGLLYVSAHVLVKNSISFVFILLRKRSRINTESCAIISDMPRKKNPAAVALGRLGGKKGGPARAAKMTAEELTESARKAVNARWAKYRAKKVGGPDGA